MEAKLYVGNLPFSMDDGDLQSLFAQAGTVKSAQVIKDRVSGRSKGFGFVEMPDDEAAKKAIESLNGSELGGRPIVVNEAQERKEGERRSSFGGGNRGGGGGGYNRGGGGGNRGGGGGGYSRSRNDNY